MIRERPAPQVAESRNFRSRGEQKYIDLVFSSFMFHHLEGGDRQKTLSRVRRVLKPGSTYLISKSIHRVMGCSICFTRATVLRDNTETRSPSWAMRDFQIARRSQFVPLSVVLGAPDTIKRPHHDGALKKCEATHTSTVLNKISCTIQAEFIGLP